MIGNRSMIWLNEIAWFLHHHPGRAGQIVSGWLGLARTPRRRPLLARLIAAYDPQGIAELLGKLRSAIGSTPERLAQAASLYLDREEIEEMAQSGFAFGNHSGSHAVLSRLPEEECRKELRGPGMRSKA